MDSNNSLDKFAETRMRLAGGSVLKKTDPWFLPTESLIYEDSHPIATNFNFSHYDYLALAKHPTVIKAATDATETLGTGVSASRLVGGERKVQSNLEQELAAFTGREDTLVLVSGYLTNVTLVGHMLGQHDLIMYDELCHNSIILGINCSRAKSISFKHNDLGCLENLLESNRRQHKRCLIVVESLYSMDGDLVDLSNLLKLKDRFDCWLLVDEAHSFGTLGSTGRGCCEYFGVSPKSIDLTTGTLSKTFASTGGFIAASSKIIRWLKYTLPGFVYSVGISPAAAASARAALEILDRTPARVLHQQKLSQYFFECAQSLGIDTGGSVGKAIIPIHLSSNQEALVLSEELLKRGFYLPPIVKIGVPKDKPRLRAFVRYDHLESDIDHLLETIKKIQFDTKICRK